MTVRLLASLLKAIVKSVVLAVTVCLAVAVTAAVAWDVHHRDTFSELRDKANAHLQLTEEVIDKKQINCIVELYRIADTNTEFVQSADRYVLRDLSVDDEDFGYLVLKTRDCIQDRAQKTLFVESVSDEDAVAWSLPNSRETAIVSVTQKTIIFIGPSII